MAKISFSFEISRSSNNTIELSNTNSEWERKYSAALEIYKEEYLQEIDRFKTLDEKANKILVIVGFLIAALIALIGNIKPFELLDLAIVTPNLYWTVTIISLSLYILCFFLLFQTTYFLLKVLDVKPSSRFANFANQRNFDTTDANGWFYEQIHLYEECKEKIEKTNSNKIELIKKSTNYLKYSIVILFLTFILIPLIANGISKYHSTNCTSSTTLTK